MKNKDTIKSTDNIKISIVVPIYNVEKYLNRCIDSILAQTYKNIEIILVNDGSKDSCGTICDSYAKKDTRVKVIHQNNKGLPAARNAGMKLMTGKYVGFIDSDDEIDDKMVDDFVKVIQKNNHPDIITSDIFQYKPDNIHNERIINPTYIYEKLLGKDEIKENYLKAFFSNDLRNLPSVCNKFYRISFLQKHDFWFDESLPRAADYWFNLMVFQKANSLYSIDKAYYHYYVIKESNIRRYRRQDFEYFILTRRKKISELLKMNFELDSSVIDTYYLNNINEYILSMLNNESFFFGYKRLYSILEDIDFNEIIVNSKKITTHTKLIYFFRKYNIKIFQIIIYYLWALKSRFVS